MYKYLSEAKSGLLNKAIKWNFTKFLIDSNGNEMKEKAKEIPAKVFCSRELSVEQAVNLREELKVLLARLDNK